ncbi:hypothetical protein YPPY92_0740, partial [Yersinia pestis PY-92]
MAGGGGG